MKVACPTCKKMVEWKDNTWRPFCSERCKLIDLGEWSSDGYAIPSEDPLPDAADFEDDKP